MLTCLSRSAPMRGRQHRTVGSARSFVLFQRLFLVVATLFCTLLLAACDRVAPQREAPCVTQAATAKTVKACAKASRSCATHEKKARSAWNQLRANLRHADEPNRGVMIDEDDDDGDEPDLTTLSIWDDFNDEGSTSDGTARTSAANTHARDTLPDEASFLSAIRKSRGHDGGMERPPRG